MLLLNEIRFSMMDSFYSKKAKRWLPSPNVQNYKCEDWAAFCEFMKAVALMEQPSKAEAPLISPAFYDNTVYRKNVNVSGWSFLALDFDSGSLSIEDTINTLDQQNINYVIYSTASSTKQKEKFRVFIPFNRNVLPNEMDDVWAGAFKLFGEVGDPQCKDKSRGYYVPGVYPDAEFFFLARSDANPLDIEELKKLAPAKRPPAPVVPFTPVTGIVYNWTGIDDCPFVKAQWIRDYIELPSGQDQHYQAVYKFMLRVAGRAKDLGYQMNTGELAALARELDFKKDGRWNRAARNWNVEASNALAYVGI